MAPKGGKGGGSSSSKSGGISGCSDCTAALQLQGSDWQNKFIIGWLALAGVVALFLLACLLLQTRFKWVRDVKVDKLRNSGYKIATVSLFIVYAFDITDTVLREEQYVTTHLYYLVRIFSNFFWRVADILILGIIYRTIAESSQANLARKLAGLHTWIIIFLTMLTMSGFGAYTAIYAKLITGSAAGSTMYKAFNYISVAYHSLYLIAALLAGLESLTVMIRARTKQTLIMVVFVTSFLTLRSLFNLISVALNTYANTSSTHSTFYSVNWACNYIGSLSDIFIYGGVVLIGFLTFRKGASRSGKYVGGTANGAHDTHYAPVSGWK